VPLVPHVDAFEQEFAAAVGSRPAVGRRVRRGSGAAILCVLCALCGAILSGSICELRRSRKEQPVSSYGAPLERMQIRYFLASAVVCLGSKI
jgi:hypothetical protein